ncbi:hypothetical protein Q7P37_002721 [Cladosporium fusiforme]
MDTNDCLNILEQRPGWARLTTNIAWCFSRPEGKDISQLIETLQNGFEKLAASFPWVAGQVINEGCDPAKNNTGVYRIVERSTGPEVIVRDHRGAPSVPDFHELKRAGFSTQLLDEAIFAPRPTLALEPGVVNAILLVQANIISDGFILVFSGNHSAMDMPGQTQVIRWFDKACRGEPFGKEELEIGNAPRRNMIPLLDSSYKLGHELLDQTLPNASTTSPPMKASAPVRPHWATFCFPSASVAALKATADATRTSAYVSTDDALSAFLWQSISRSRLHRLDPNSLCTAGRAMNARRALDVPPQYPGLVQNTLFHKLTLSELADLPLGVVASVLRDRVTCSSPSVSYYTRALATALSRSADKGFLKVAARLDWTKDVLLTSHASMRAYDLDFSLRWGMAEAVRHTRLVELEGLTYLLPAAPSGDIAVTICLREEDLYHLRADGLMLKYAEYMG